MFKSLTSGPGLYYPASNVDERSSNAIGFYRANNATKPVAPHYAHTIVERSLCLKLS